MKRALVTGGASPLGSAICRRLAADGHRVIVHAHANAPGAQALAAEISGEVITCDIADVTATAIALAPVLDAGAPQIVIHNAGIHDDVPLAAMTEAQWRGVLDVSLTGFFAVMRPLILPMLGPRWGRVVVPV